MEKVKILGIVGSPRKNGNTVKLVERALDAAGAFPWVETDTYHVAGKKVGHCISCYKCMEKLECVIKDGLQAGLGGHIATLEACYHALVPLLL